MKLLQRYADLSLIDKKLIYCSCFLLIGALIWSIVGYINYNLGNLIAHIPIMINGVEVNKTAVLIAPVVEESLKLFGYGIIFLFDFNKIFMLKCKSKNDFINRYLPVTFLIVVSSFGILEGIVHNSDYCIFCVPSFVYLNMLSHITYSAYPLVLGRKYKNCFICFLPIAIILHFIHNYLVTVVWDNKWVTIILVTVFLLPIILIKRKSVISLSSKILKNDKSNLTDIILILVLIFNIMYVYMLFCCWMVFI